MFPSNSLSDLHLQYTDKTPVNGRSYSPFSPRLYDLDDEFIFEQLLFQEQQVAEARGDGGSIDFTGSGNMRVETESGADLPGLPVSPNKLLQSKARPSKNTTSKVEGSKKLQLMPRKRTTGKKDRHSKIHTAQGLRDRRIRLSVHIARKFFDLQEMLGLDKASKTIEWLLAESQDAIDELSKKNCSHSNRDSTPDSVMVSEINEADEEEEEVQGCGQSKKRKVSGVQISCTKRDSRDKARARSSGRTRGQLKMKGMNLEDLQEVNEEEKPHCISLDGGILGQPARDLDHLNAHETNSLSIIEKFLGITSTATKPGSYPDSSLGNDCYSMIGGVDFLEGNVEEFAGSKSSSFTASNNSSQGKP